jgi:amidohydrolase
VTVSAFLRRTAPAELVTLRHALHRRPELSGEERETAAHIITELKRNRPDEILTELGGHGVAAVYDSGAAGPTVLFRCELDGLPIAEISSFGWRSEITGKGHLCGHDGHMAILCGLAMQLAENRPARGKVVLLFQPAEETGAGAADVIADPRFERIRPDFAFALHNLPGLPLGAVGVRPGPFTFASEGLAARLSGRTAHAAQPEAGLSPAAVMGRLMDALPELPETLGHEPGHSLVTLSHARLGEAAFGISPGEADIWVTIRAIDDELQAQLMGEAEQLVRRLADAGGLGVDFAGTRILPPVTMTRRLSQPSRPPLRRLGRDVSKSVIHSAGRKISAGSAAWRKRRFSCLGRARTIPGCTIPISISPTS